MYFIEKNINKLKRGEQTIIIPLKFTLNKKNIKIC